MKKDEQIARLRSSKTYGNSERHGMTSPTYGSASKRKHSVGATRHSQRLSGAKCPSEKASSDMDNSSEYSDKHSEAGSQQSVDDLKRHREFFLQSRLTVVSVGEQVSDDLESKLDSPDRVKNYDEDVELLGFGDNDSEERLSDISDGVLSMGTETDVSINSIVEYTLFPETAKPAADNGEK